MSDFLHYGYWRLGLFEQCPLVSTNRLHLFHPLLDGGLREKRPLLEFLQDAGPFILLFESPNSLVNRLIVTDDNTDQKIHLLKGLA